MIRACESCVHHGRDCDPIRCIEGGALLRWSPRTEFQTFTEAADYRDQVQPDHFRAERRDGVVYAEME